MLLMTVDELCIVRLLTASQDKSIFLSTIRSCVCKHWRVIYGALPYPNSQFASQKPRRPCWYLMMSSHWADMDTIWCSSGGIWIQQISNHTFFGTLRRHTRLRLAKITRTMAHQLVTFLHFILKVILTLHIRDKRVKNAHPYKQMLCRRCSKVNQHAPPLHGVNLGQRP